MTGLTLVTLTNWVWVICIGIAVLILTNKMKSYEKNRSAESMVSPKKETNNPKSFMTECSDHFKEMHKCCLDMMCDNAYTRGKAGIDINLEKDVYKLYTDFEKVKISTSYIQGKLEGKIEKLERESVRNGKTNL